MSQTAVLVWLSANFLLPTFRADLDALAASGSVRLEAPPENARRFHASAYAPNTVAHIETLLEEARNAAASLETNRAHDALERADHALREHPELPQSAWLMGEILQRSADLRRGEANGTELARTLSRRARALEGPRAVPFDDHSLLDEAALLTTHSVELAGMERGDELEWDGLPSSTTVVVAPGEHHVRVLRNSDLLWAGWLEVDEAAARVELPVPVVIPCSADDVGRASFEQSRAVPWPAARCGLYLLARAAPGGRLEAAWCRAALCSRPLPVQRPASAPAVVEHRSAAWPYAVAASAGLLLLSGAVLWQTGAFAGHAPQSNERWVYEGPQALGLRF